MSNEYVKNRGNAQRLNLERKILKNHQSMSILQLIRQVRYISEHDKQQQRNLHLRSIISKRQVEQCKANMQDACLMMPIRIPLIDKKLFFDRRISRAMSIEQMCQAKCKLEIVPESNTTVKINFNSSTRRCSLDSPTRSNRNTEELRRDQGLPCISNKGSKTIKEGMSRQSIAKKLKKINADLSGWSSPDDNKEDSPADIA